MNNAVGVFLRECCEIGPQYEVMVCEPVNAFNSWAKNKGSSSEMTPQLFGICLREVVRIINTKNLRIVGDTRARVFTGIRLKAEHKEEF